MSQNRPAPAYMEYAAATLTGMRFRMMTPAQRGLCWTMKLELWVNHTLPSNPDSLARVLGLDPAEVRSELPAVLPIFDIKDGWIISPELEDYRAHLKGIREKQKAGGKRGAEITNGQRKTIEKQAAPGKPSGNPRVPRASTRGSLVQFNPVQPN